MTMAVPNILLWNVCSIRKRKTELLYMLNSNRVEVAIISETWLKASDLISIPQYRIVRADRSQFKRGGGVAILIHVSLDYLVIHSPSILSFADQGIDSLFIKLPSMSLVIGAVYCPPKTRISTKFLDIITSKFPKYIIGGDFNSRHSSWNNSTFNINGKTLYAHLIGRPYFIIHPLEFTYHDPPRNSSTIDIFLTNVQRSFNCSTVDNVSTQHLPVKLTDAGKDSTLPHWALDTDWRSYSLDTNKYKLRPTLESIDAIDDCITDVTSFIHDSYKKNTVVNAPNGQSTIFSYHTDYFNDALLNSLLKRRHKYRRLLQKSGDCHFRALIKSSSQEINNRLKYLRNESFHSKLKSLHKSDPTFWKAYRILTSKKTNIPPIKKSNTLLTTDLDKAEEFALSFAKVHQLTVAQSSNHDPSVDALIAQLDNDAPPNNLDEFYIQRNLISDAINGLKNKALGPDRITAPLIKGLGFKLRLQLYYIFNACIKLSYFPKVWKVASICAIPKPGKSKTLVDSYRPISLISTLSKLFEKCIYSYLNTFLARNNVLLNQQFGFRRAHSTIHQLIRVSQHLTHEVNVRRSVAIVLLDLSKAFDTVWHDGLVFKLVNLKLPNSFLKLIRSYLTDRYIFCNINGSRSTKHLVTAGVPQGSILGPLLFNIYINDIPLVNNCHLALYADDTMLISSSTNHLLLVKKLQHYLNTVSEFFNDWKLTLNASKTEALVILSRTKKTPNSTVTLPSLIVNGVTIPWSNSVRYLGIIIDNRLSWNPAVMDRIDKTHKAFAASAHLFNHKSYLKRNLKLTLYKTCLRTVLFYGAHVWLSASHSILYRLRILQNKILKTILRRPVRTPTAEILKETNIEYISKYLADLISRYNVSDHPNPLIQLTANYKELPYTKLRRKFPLHCPRFENFN